MLHSPFHPMPEWEGDVLQESFTFPFAYLPSPHCRQASAVVRQHLAGHDEWTDELADGKMFGVLEVVAPDGARGFLASFSGTLGGRLCQDWFVAPVLEFDNPKGYFKQEEAQISAINALVESAVSDPVRVATHEELSRLRGQSQSEVEAAKALARQHKAERDQMRSSATDEQLAVMVRQSQFDKAEVKRVERRWASLIAECEERLRVFDARQADLCRQRKERSEALQHWLFDHMRVCCHDGQSRSVWDVFQDAQRGVPPSGTGDCAAPKLLHFAFSNGFVPISMAEFWVGGSRAGEQRHDGVFYPACQTKCGPLLRQMMAGMRVEPNPLVCAGSDAVDVLFEDEWLLIVNKPSGLMTASDDTSQDSMLRRVSSRWHISGPGYVHRLDMSTSGVLIFAKDKQTHKLMQALFEGRDVRKRYVAVIVGRPQAKSGVVDLPLAPDYADRPRQKVDRENGKPALTRYEVLASSDGRTRVALHPFTGRTHQLRVHCASPEGLGCPIVGDNLYGVLDRRLLLHSDLVEFVHPHTGVKVRVECQPDF